MRLSRTSMSNVPAKEFVCCSPNCDRTAVLVVLHEDDYFWGWATCGRGKHIDYVLERAEEHGEPLEPVL